MAYPHVYIIDNPSMPEKRIKEVNSIRYNCGRLHLLKFFKNSSNFTYIYTGDVDLKHEAQIKLLNQIEIIKIIASKSNKMRDFTGYFEAINDSLINNYEDIIICNSSCPAQGLNSLYTFENEDDIEGVLGIGAKSFYRMSSFNVKLNPHLQSYAIRLIGAKSIQNCKKFLDYCSANFKDITFEQESVKKRHLIEQCEIGLNDYFKNNGINRYFVKENGALIKVPDCYGMKFPFYDSRLNDVRFTS